MFNKRIVCRYCFKGNAIKKHGTAPSGYQRYLCGHCKRTFQGEYIYNAYKSPEELEKKKEYLNKERLSLLKSLSNIDKPGMVN
ncbi:IS1 family transposase [Budviciaceae bacterium BWR-B9]|uniref:IS1 family transposase n=1 Tax=Limnobaculum allomyrinae TaxID=2791986 RepID=A0ABS1ILI5_9GAMM|nr:MULTISPECIES: hypothetical protein [Limnobaculum]MBK5142608.1 IS1 family transposase [Limnobaculum allomyrinae]MBV7690506.1 hypothetical protein [Limnobaculum sp. M2-1]